MDKAAKTFDSKAVEEACYAFWEASQLFNTNPASDKPPFAIMIPPPNVTGVLHMGHALVNTLIDILTRYKRMQGYEVLWQPGTDHAGISTQTVVEKHLIETQGKRRKDFSREEFLSHVWAWKERSEAHILNQLKKLGASADWSRSKFTMQPELNKSVRTIFKKMYDSGLIYRGDYLVNWDPLTQTALADDEVEYEEVPSSLWYFTYPIEGSDETVCVATTRPETMLGDTAVAVSPSDPRYTHLIGKRIILPLTNRIIPIVADHYVDPEFGTGVVKITPAHDPNDYEIGLRHDLPMINIMTPDGKINDNGAPYTGLSMLEARKAIVAKMQTLGRLKKTDPYTHRIGVSYRSKATIEPYLSKQWFVRISHFKDKLLEAVQSDKVRLIPKHWESTYFQWINNLRDWCISRQLWWGHRIPIWYHKEKPETIICYDGDGLPPEVAASPDEWEQDEDVLDTWFSSALWPFSSLGWPDNTDELTKFYPNSTLITGHDILFFWVARMIFMGEYALGEVPFKETFLHGLIYGKSYWRKDAEGHIRYVAPEEKKQFDLGEKLPEDVFSKWEKMSKSKGNVIDPIEIIDAYGADALRMALAASATHARQIDLDRRRFEEYKNFANKVWNGARFVFMNLDITGEELAEGIDKTLYTLEDRWIFSATARVIKDVTDAIENYKFDIAATAAYAFFWDSFCAYYVETTKPYLFHPDKDPQKTRNKKRILCTILLKLIRLMHPMAPFITEELYQHLKKQFGKHLPELNHVACMTAPFPTYRQEDIDTAAEKDFRKVCDYIYALRNIRAEMGLPPTTSITVYYSGSESERAFFESHRAVVEALVPIERCIQNDTPSAKLVSHARVGELIFTVPLPDSMKEKELARLQKRKIKLEKMKESAENKLASSSFVEKAPKHLVEQTKAALEEAVQELSEIEEKVAHLS